MIAPPGMSARGSVVVLVLALVLLAGGAGETRRATAAASEPSAATTTPLIDANLTGLGCLAGLSLGAAAVDLYPIYRWTFYDFPGGWMPGWVAMGTRMALGCLFGGLTGAGVSLTRAANEALGW